MSPDQSEQLKRALRGRTAVFIDAANLEQSVKDMHVIPKDVPDKWKAYTADKLRWRVDYECLTSFFKSHCTLQHIRFYSASFGTEPHLKFLGFLKRHLGFNLVTKPLKEYRDHTPEVPHRKANCDVEIATDATFTLDDYNTFVLFSGDSDFEYLLKFLRGQNKTTVVFSRTGHVARELPAASNYYFDIVDFRQDFLNVDEKKEPLKAKNPA